MILLTLAVPQLIARIYTDDAVLIAASIPVLRVISVAILFCAVSNIIFNGVSGTGNTRTAFFIEVVTLFFYLSYVYYTSVIHPSAVEIVWMSEFVYWILIGGMGYLYLMKGNWRKREI